MVICCGGGMTYECEMVAHTLSEIVLKGHADLKIADVVALCSEVGSEVRRCSCARVLGAGGSGCWC